MPRFLVAYNLSRPDENYQHLYRDLESLGAKRIQDCVWLLRRDDETPLSLRKRLFAYVDDEKDRLLVARIDTLSSRNGMVKIGEI
jgi:CRISPR/Cas system-associated endoribonuclease Cas2